MCPRAPAQRPARPANPCASPRRAPGSSTLERRDTRLDRKPKRGARVDRTVVLSTVRSRSRGGRRQAWVRAGATSAEPAARLEARARRRSSRRYGRVVAQQADVPCTTARWHLERWPVPCPRSTGLRAPRVHRDDQRCGWTQGWSYESRAGVRVSCALCGESEWLLVRLRSGTPVCTVT
eukprot:7302928-Prymnesium_polylepis.4